MSGDRHGERETVDVVVEPRGYRFPASPDRSIMQAAVDCGYRWPTVCGGRAECTACFVQVLEGAEGLSPILAAEDAALDALRRRFPGVAPGGIRLACQARPSVDVRVRKIGVRPDERLGAARPPASGERPGPGG